LTNWRCGLAELASVKRDSAAGDGFGNAGMTYSINVWRCLKRAAPHIFGALQLASQIVVP
jgi:hypothetical protein